tara:strand:- start:22 stop:933 length:912 start_codon:yes stop_codon:yes gene_type:complete
MGKRKLHETNVHFCDWTGIPMKSMNCYMPMWGPDGMKTTAKHGSYCNWESVLAHAAASCDADTYAKTSAFVNAHVGCTVLTAPHHSELKWFGGEETAESFQAQCVSKDAVVTAVLIDINGEMQEIYLDAHKAIDSNFAGDLLRKPVSHEGPQHKPSRFKPQQKRGGDVSVYHWDIPTLALNATVSNIFKTQIRGECIVLLQSKEACFVPRERYVNYTVSAFKDQFVKRKRLEATAIQPEEYKKLQKEMQSSLNSYEQAATSGAEKPMDLAKAANMPPALGKELAKLKKLEARMVDPAPMVVVA